MYYTLKLKVYKLSNRSQNLYALDRNSRDLINTKALGHWQIRNLLTRNKFYACGSFVYRESNDELIGTIYKKDLARRVRVCYSLDKKRENKRIWNA